MACSRCGAVAALDDASCSVCNPWAAPKQQASRSTAGVPQRQHPAIKHGDLPPWLRVLIRINPPARHDLDKAWQVTTRFTYSSFAYFVLVGVCSIFMATGHRMAYPIFMLLLAAYLLTAQRMRRTAWLARAVAVVGTRPDIGYQRFARIPALARVTTLNKVVSVAICVLFLARISTLDPSLPSAVNIGIWVLIWMVAAVSSGCTFALHSRARKDLDRLLAVSGS